MTHITLAKIFIINVLDMENIKEHLENNKIKKGEILFKKVDLK
jgi:hypothetical protein